MTPTGIWESVLCMYTKATIKLHDMVVRRLVFEHSGDESRVFMVIREWYVPSFTTICRLRPWESESVLCCTQATSKIVQMLFVSVIDFLK